MWRLSKQHMFTSSCHFVAPNYAGGVGQGGGCDFSLILQLFQAGEPLTGVKIKI